MKITRTVFFEHAKLFGNDLIFANISDHGFFESAD